ncbi:MAG: (2Fe-2S) ferredoxin domain-containing protein [Magnetococcales bacterium]|nr:(2Fe-2S) ferredoxin domain-containing protein [Magnetococcales bacterium]
MTYKLIVCIKERFTNAPSCAGGGSVAMVKQLEQIIQRRGLKMEIEQIHCLGQCNQGPNMRIAPGKDMYHHVTPQDLEGIIDKLAFYNATAPALGQET